VNATRRLAAILAADVAGYSRLMGADEEGTLRRLKALRVEVIDPTIVKHYGRIVKTTGDACWSSSQVSSMPCGVQPNGSTAWPHLTPMCRRPAASNFA
jgi:adenylate cyclase